MSDSGSNQLPPLRIRAAWPGRYPALPAAICFMLGIALHAQLPLQAGALLLLGASMSIAAVTAPWRTAANICLVLGIAPAGAAWAQLARFHIASGHVAHYLGESPRLAWLEVSLDETPRLLRTTESAIPRPPKHTCIARVERVRSWDGWRDASGEALLQFDSPAPEVRAGDRLRLLGLIERPGEAMNPGQFDYAAYYRASGVLASISVDGPQNVTLLERASPSLLSRARQQVRNWLTAGFSARQQEEAAILRALILGERDPVMNDAREAFRKSGTSHHLAISGLHIAIVGGVVLGLMRLTGFGPRASLIAGATTIAVYGLLALPSAPVIRATVLALTFGAGVLAGRRASGVQLLSFAAIFVLLVNPLDLFRAGFQLTFAIVLGLLIFSWPLQRWLARATSGTDLELLRQPRHPLLFVTEWLDRRMINAIAAAVAAWLVSMPLVAVHFEQFNPWAIPASLVSSPFVFLSLLSGVLKVVSTAIAPSPSEVWASAAAQPVSWMLAIVRWFAGQPGADVPLPKPHLSLVFLFYCSTVFWVVRLPMPGLRWLSRAALPLLAYLIFVQPFTAQGISTRPQPLSVTVLAVGAGQCVVVETPGGRVAMVDVGSTSLGDPIEKCVAPFLRTRGYTRVDLLVISHANWDHYGGAADLTRRYSVGEVVVGGNFAGDARAFASGRRMLDELVHLDRPPRIVDVGDELPLGRQTKITVLWPPAEATGLSSNDGSLVVRLEHAGRRILFAGDIQEEAMRRLLAGAADDPALLRADVLVAPHHGSSEEITPRFIAAVDPRWIIASNGRVLSAKQRRFAQMTGGRTLLRTHETGAVSIQVEEDGRIAVETFLERGGRPLSWAE